MRAHYHQFTPVGKIGETTLIKGKSEALGRWGMGGGVREFTSKFNYVVKLMMRGVKN